MSLRKLPLLLALLASLGLVACGGDDNAVSSDASVDELIKKTFTGDKKIDSGRFDMTFTLTATGADLDGPVNVKVSGPFESQGKGKLPKFDIDVSFEGAGQSIRAGVASTADKGFVAFNGTEYAVSDEVFAQFKKGFEDASKEGNAQNQSLASLGIQPEKWLKNPKKAGEAKVGDTDTIKITGEVDVNALLDDVNDALGQIRSLGIQGAGQVPSKLTDEQRKQVTDAVKKLAVEIYTGKEDAILRRFVVDLAVEVPDEGSGTLKLDVQLLDLNESQDIKAPEDPKPFDQLLSQLGPYLGALGGGNAGGSSGSGGGSGSSSDEALKKYSDCIAAAGSDVEKARECSELLAG